MPRRSVGRWWVVGLGLFALAGGLAAPRTTRGADPSQPLYHKSRSFRIPFNVEPADRPRLKQVQLWVSQDKGYSWKEWNHTGPDQPAFTFQAPSDAEYWFAVRTLDTKGRLFPADDSTVEPSMKVVVDTTTPTIDLAPMGRRGSRASVRWEIRDANLDPRSLLIEYQAPGARDWRQVPNLKYALLGAAEWDAGTADPIKIRATVEDRAHNRAEAEIDLPDGLAANPGAVASDPRDFAQPPAVAPIAPAALTGPASDPLGPVDPPTSNPDDGARPAPPQASANGTLLVGNPRFPLAYAVEDAGPAGASLVELWITRDGGRTWSRMPEDPDRVSPYNVDLGGEGTFGLWLVVQGANGLGDPPPAPGDRPQMWVEVDSAVPVVALDPPRVGTGAQAGRVTITWRAGDAHLAPRPIVISYRPDRSEAPWTPITSRIENTGSYTWNVPPNVPPRFQLRVDAFDTLGNRGFAETSSPILVDRTRPKGRIIGLDPGARGGLDATPRR